MVAIRAILGFLVKKKMRTEINTSYFYTVAHLRSFSHQPSTRSSSTTKKRRPFSQSASPTRPHLHTHTFLFQASRTQHSGRTRTRWAPWDCCMAWLLVFFSHGGGVDCQPGCVIIGWWFLDPEPKFALLFTRRPMHQMSRLLSTS